MKDSQDSVVLNFKMSHSVRNYGDETNDKNNNSMGIIRARGTQEPYRQTYESFPPDNYPLVAAICEHGDLQKFLDHYQQTKKGSRQGEEDRDYPGICTIRR